MVIFTHRDLDHTYRELSVARATLVPTCFSEQKKLLDLRLNNNKIFKLSNVTFDGLKTLTILSLRKEFIEEMSSSNFLSLKSVEELDLH